MRATGLALISTQFFFGCTPASTGKIAYVTGPAATPRETYLEDEEEQTKAAVDQALAIVEKDRPKSEVSTRDPQHISRILKKPT